VSALDAWNMLTPWMDLAETIEDNSTFVNASVAIQLAVPTIPSTTLLRFRTLLDCPTPSPILYETRKNVETFLAMKFTTQHVLC
jgi:hypothetical protein